MILMILPSKHIRSFGAEMYQRSYPYYIVPECAVYMHVVWRSRLNMRGCGSVYIGTQLHPRKKIAFSMHSISLSQQGGSSYNISTRRSDIPSRTYSYGRTINYPRPDTFRLCRLLFVWHVCFALEDVKQRSLSHTKSPLVVPLSLTAINKSCVICNGNWLLWRPQQ